MPELIVRITGPDAEALAQQLAEHLAANFGGAYTPRPEPIENDETRRLDADLALRVAQLVLTIPVSVLATMTLAERLKVVEKLRSLRAWVKEHSGKDQRVEISGETLPAQPLAEAEPGKVIDAAIEATGTKEGGE